MLTAPPNDPAALALWLAAAEAHFGGYVTGVERRIVSEADPRTSAQLAVYKMTGGDRMSGCHHGYGPAYARHIAPFIGRKDLTIIEIGILKGQGLALWNACFPDARIIGLDIDIGYTQENMPHLKQNGAFGARAPELHIFDQFKSAPEQISQLQSIMKDSTASIVIDDGVHSSVTIVNSLAACIPFLANEFVYFIEDNPFVGKILEEQNLDFVLYSYNELTVLTSKQP